MERSLMNEELLEEETAIGIRLQEPEKADAAI